MGVWYLLASILRDVGLILAINDDFTYKVTGVGNQTKLDKKATKEYYHQTGNSDYMALLRRLEFEIVLLSYVMKEDDGQLTMDETKLIRDHIKSDKMFLKKEDVKHIKQMLKKDISESDVIRFCQLGNYTFEEVQRGIGLLHIMNQVTGRYDGILRSLKQQFQYHMDYIF